jgi:hypothetical protein
LGAALKDVASFRAEANALALATRELPRQDRVCLGRGVRVRNLICAAAIALSLLPPQGRAGPLRVEDADIDKPGSCKAQSWASFDGGHGFRAAGAAACGAEIGRPVELELEFERERSGREWSSAIGIEAKTQVWQGGKVAIAIQGGSGFDLSGGQLELLFVRAPVSLELREGFRVNLNIGWRYDADDRWHSLVYGAGFEWKVERTIAIVGEIFARVGRHDPEQPYATRPETQFGFRYSPTAQLRFDVLYGHNIMRAGGNWLTVGMTVRN